MQWSGNLNDVLTSGRRRMSGSQAQMPGGPGEIMLGPPLLGDNVVIA